CQPPRNPVRCETFRRRRGSIPIASHRYSPAARKEPAMLRATLAVVAIALIPLAVPAADPVSTPKTVMSECGKLLFADDFTQPLGKDWRSGKGKWEIVDGALRGAELKADKHGAVTRRALPLRNAVIQFSFKLDGTRQTTLSINDAKGHCCR